MKRTLAVGALLYVVALFPAGQALAAASENGRPGTVDYFTPSEKARAFKAATEAGYVPINVESFQAGDFFLTTSKRGESYELTVVPSGQVYPSSPMVLPW